jgi:hypothetical protein
MIAEERKRERRRAMKIASLRAETVKVLEENARGNGVGQQSDYQELEWAIATLARFVHRSGAPTGGIVDEALHILNNHVIRLAK